VCAATDDTYPKRNVRFNQYKQFSISFLITPGRPGEEKDVPEENLFL
jgi:hypothetical protein